MKREGRQHGMVRTYRVLPSPWNPRPEPRFVQQVNSPTTAGLFTKVPVEPTNHSKFTGRCGRPRCLGCHMHPAFKSKDKAKGTHKFRSNDMATNYRLVTWKVVDKRPGLNFSGFSAARMLDHLSSDYEGYDNDDDDDQCHVVNDGLKASSQSQEEVENHEGKTEDDDEKHEGVDVDDMKFVLDRELEEEGWCLVGEI
ncbi:hypothetical protein ES319_A05G360700v1 [Gossypium barbadense]|uniref:Uncharacterized protein n=3 Tax=Gossypium TaxID=3633 RepID=A0ABR0Q9S2_GOSAR|nr:uncharacterized protein LOC108459967 [Gossypium arboreum]KAB2084839.1 hypothetical protein ES319_A05G360700v1 [Gossypium barbadense]KAK5835746.1 hypothetical protein PVK06_011448 [Gossypium arboreum]TYH19803.1 hypothetical protein ES288_A05G381000v1 [Gossypium darwinii]